MKINNKLICLLLSAALLLTIFSSRGNSGELPDISSYRDIPGVTDEEITAIEELKSTRQSFSYGSLLTKELFLLPDGTLAGFTAMFCELMSDLFGVPFVPMLRSWDSLKIGLDERVIDFTGDLSPTPELMPLYFMTYPIAERSLIIFTRDDSKIITEDDVGGLRIGFLERTSAAQSILDAYPALTFETEGARNIWDAFEKLRSGAIDAFVDDTVEPYSYDIHSFQEFFPLVYTPVSMTTANPNSLRLYPSWTNIFPRGELTGFTSYTGQAITNTRNMDSTGL